jgi:hypothetical protein
MTNQELIAYHDQNNVTPYHGIKYIDALKHLSEIPGLPGIIVRDYSSQYEKALRGMDTCRVPNMGENLYNKYRGETCIERVETVKEYTYKGVTMRAVKIRMTRFERMNEYFLEHNERGFGKTEYIVLDIQAGCASTLQMLLNQPGSAKRLYCYDGLLKQCDEQEWNVVNHFHKPYNGIEADRIIDIYRGLAEPPGYRSFSEANVTAYIETVTKHFYFLGIEPIIEEIIKLKR